MITEDELFLPQLREMNLAKFSLGLYSMCGVTAKQRLVEWIWSSETGAMVYINIQTHRQTHTHKSLNLPDK